MTTQPNREEEAETEVQALDLPADHYTSAEIDIQIATARRYPRAISRFKKLALSMATDDVETAASCFYTLPRKDKSISGPGVRLAEIVGSAWGNMRYGARVVREENGFIIAQGMAHDLETNVAIQIEVRRRITDKYGKRYNDDMIGVTANAACAIALRNAIFKVVPRTYVDSIYQAAKQVAIGDASTLASRRAGAIEFFGKMGVKQEQILGFLGRDAVEDINLQDIEKLLGLKTALKDGDTTIDETFPPVPKGPKRQSEQKPAEAPANQREPGAEG